MIFWSIQSMFTIIIYFHSILIIVFQKLSCSQNAPCSWKSLLNSHWVKELNFFMSDAASQLFHIELSHMKIQIFPSFELLSLLITYRFSICSYIQERWPHSSRIRKRLSQKYRSVFKFFSENLPFVPTLETSISVKAGLNNSLNPVSLTRPLCQLHKNSLQKREV